MSSEYSEYDALPDRDDAAALRSRADALPELAAFGSLCDIRDAVEAREETALRQGVAQGKDAYEKAIQKWFHHYDESDSERESDVEAAVLPDPGDAPGGADGAEYVLVRSEMYSGRKAEHDDEDDGTYHAVWVVGELPEDEGHDHDYYIHRVEWSKRCERELREWTVDDVRDAIGAPGGSIRDADSVELGTWYRVHGDVRVRVRDHDGDDDGEDPEDRWVYARVGRHVIGAHGSVRRPDVGEGVMGAGRAVVAPGEAEITVSHPEHHDVTLDVAGVVVEAGTLSKHSHS